MRVSKAMPRVAPFEQSMHVFASETARTGGLERAPLSHTAKQQQQRAEARGAGSSPVYALLSAMSPKEVQLLGGIPAQRAVLTRADWSAAAAAFERSNRVMVS